MIIIDTDNNQLVLSMIFKLLVHSFNNCAIDLRKQSMERYFVSKLSRNYVGSMETAWRVIPVMEVSWKN